VTFQRQIFNTVLAALIAVVWIFGVNHCVVAALASRSPKVHCTHCPSDRSEHAPQMFGCCQALNSSDVKPVDNGLHFSGSPFLAILPYARLSIDSLNQRQSGLFSDSGPPPGIPLFRTLLCRCTPSNAP
jgi:hypothetical protein